TLVVSARWGAWELALEGCLGAAKALGDRSVEAWVLHEMGTRAVCLGDERTARRLLTQAAALREAAGEHAAAAISRRNLGSVPAAVTDDSRDDPAPSPAHAFDFASLPLSRRAETRRHSRKTSGAGALLGTFLTCAILGGLVYGGMFGGLPWPSSQ